MATSYREVIEELRAPTRALRQASGPAWRAFGELHEAAVADGELPARVKELIALAIAVVKECDGCIAYHAKAAARRGATVREVVEALDVALLMGGGPVSVYAPRAYATFCELSGSCDGEGRRTSAGGGGRE